MHILSKQRLGAFRIHRKGAIFFLMPIVLFFNVFSNFEIFGIVLNYYVPSLFVKEKIKKNIFVMKKKIKMN